MKLIQTSLSGCYIIQLDMIDDNRGSFVKTYHEPSFMTLGLETSFTEEYYSVSKKGVLRGLHFQVPPHAHTKIVYCTYGKVFDVVVDLRKGSKTYGMYKTFNVNSKDAIMIYIPIGLAHGFYALSDMAIMIYKVSTVYSPKHDSGILWNSVGINWPDGNPVVSERDSKFLTLDDFKSPFI